MKLVVKLCIHLNEYEHAIMSAQAAAETRSLTALIKYAAMQYCKSYPAKLDTKKVFNKYIAPDEVYPR